jgi:CRP/FNR family transcriptional regulator, cyclic AMP receptor protein
MWRSTGGGIVPGSSQVTDTGDRQKVWYLRQFDLLAALSDEQIEEMARVLEHRHVPAGVELLQEERSDRVHMIKTGAIRLHAGNPSHRVTVALLGEGRLFGLSATIGDDDQGIGATTLEASYVCFTTWPEMLKVFVQHPDIMLQVTRAMAEQVFQAESWHGRLGLTSPHARLADLLIELGDEFGESSSNGPRIRFRLTQADLAQMIGLSRETVSRSMAEFGRQGWISREDGLVVIRDRTSLATLETVA